MDTTESDSMKNPDEKKDFIVTSEELDSSKTDMSTIHDQENIKTSDESLKTANVESPIKESIPENPITMQMFLALCCEKIPSIETDVNKRCTKLRKLMENYKDSRCWSTSRFSDLVSYFYHKITEETDTDQLIIHYNDFIDEFELEFNKQRTTAKSKQEFLKREKTIKKTEKYLRKLLKKIVKLDQIEISIDDLDKPDNSHIKKEMYEKKAAKFGLKLLELKGLANKSGRLIDKVYKYNGTEWQPINECITSKMRQLLNSHRPKSALQPAYSIPLINELIQDVQRVSKEKNIDVGDVHKLCEKIQRDIVSEMNIRRKRELEESWIDFCEDDALKPKSIPNINDEELNKKLTENDTLMERLKEVIDQYQHQYEQNLNLRDLSDKANDGEEDDEDDENIDDIDDSDDSNNSNDIQTEDDESKSLSEKSDQNSDCEIIEDESSIVPSTSEQTLELNKKRPFEENVGVKKFKRDEENIDVICLD